MGHSLWLAWCLMCHSRGRLWRLNARGQKRNMESSLVWVGIPCCVTRPVLGVS